MSDEKMDTGAAERIQRLVNRDHGRDRARHEELIRQLRGMSPEERDRFDRELRAEEKRLRHFGV